MFHFCSPLSTILDPHCVCISPVPCMSLTCSLLVLVHSSPALSLLKCQIVLSFYLLHPAGSLSVSDAFFDQDLVFDFGFNVTSE